MATATMIAITFVPKTASACHWMNHAVMIKHVLKTICTVPSPESAYQLLNLVIVNVFLKTDTFVFPATAVFCHKSHVLKDVLLENTFVLESVRI